MHAAWWMLSALAVLAIAYRYYSAFIAAKVLCLEVMDATACELSAAAQDEFDLHQHPLGVIRVR